MAPIDLIDIHHLLHGLTTFCILYTLYIRTAVAIFGALL